ncbi:flagellar basal body rod protein FlgB [Rummeliibacillus sp. TYF005]|uniref:flagellar basal body rod protein FlgB n=1 Tax=Rummeliibacillus sp. TYF005 TaxID=2058214 RepID=UPI000F539E73|nr:flagellar basal body rod protein FlgB [Rummeliibacillus sp. TYF005]RPJ96972.1 flagellar basal body rod protein FlgB [Rummeliibacillus sp. TYF005]
MSLFSGTISNIESGLSYASVKQKTIAQNIANVDTPNYKAKDVSFSKMLTEAKESYIKAYRTNDKHIDFQTDSKAPGVYSYSNNSYRENGNGVDMDKEQASLAKNTIYYNALIERENGKLNSLLTVAKGGN